MRHDSLSHTNPSAGQIRATSSGSPVQGAHVSDEAAGRLAAENTELARRAQRLTPVLVSMAYDLACARRESAALKRENRQLRSRVTTLEQRTAAAIRSTAAIRAGIHRAPAVARSSSGAR